MNGLRSNKENVKPEEFKSEYKREQKFEREGTS